MLSILTLSLATLHYLTCRHTFEPTLISELSRGGFDKTSSPLEAVVRLEASGGAQPPDPVYALQILPDAVEVRAASAAVAPSRTLNNPRRAGIATRAGRDRSPSASWRASSVSEQKIFDFKVFYP